MIKIYDKYPGIMISGVEIHKEEDLSRYGIADLEPVEGNVYKIKKMPYPLL
jgi:UTP--glucose-1-phosphate uridylyltransferase